MSLFQEFYIMAFPILIISIAVIALLTRFTVKRDSRKKTAMIVFIVISFTFNFLSQYSPYIRSTDTKEQLLWTHNVGKYNVSDMAITWWTETATQNKFEWGNDTFAHTLKEETKSHSHSFVLNDLCPNGKYWYRVNDKDRVNFSVPDPNNFSIGLISDIHFEKTGIVKIENIQNTLKNFDSDTMFVLGDFVDLGFLDYQWKIAINTMSSYLTSSVPVHYTVGNHDTFMNGIVLYKEYVKPKKIYGDNENTSLYGKIRIGDVYLFSLRVENELDRYITDQQIAWFENELKKIAYNDTVIVISHAPFISSANINYNKWQQINAPKYVNLFTNLFEVYGVDLVFSGHQHLMEHLYRNGTHYNIIGVGSDNGGDEIDPNKNPESAIWRASASNAYGKVKINGKNNVTVTYVDGDLNTLYEYNV
jgi:UDP-2,3-diacylglucosamine pyrophosphatase LpxH